MKSPLVCESHNNARSIDRREKDSLYLTTKNAALYRKNTAHRLNLHTAPPLNRTCWERLGMLRSLLYAAAAAAAAAWSDCYGTSSRMLHLTWGQVQYSLKPSHPFIAHAESLVIRNG
jgi:hypothetical protein